jgi:hypothetical protein
LVVRLLIATSSFDHRTDDFVTASIARAVRNFRRHGHEVADPRPYSCLYVDKGRNDLTVSALAEGVDAILFWDADQTIYCAPDTDLAALFNIGPVVTAAYVSRQHPQLYVLWERTPTGWRQTTQDDMLGRVEPFQVHKCGAGAMWARREVFERIPPPWWVAGWHSRSTWVGEDMAFCDLVQSAGYKILCQPAIHTGHMTTGLLTHRPGGILGAVPGEVLADEAQRIRMGDAIRRGYMEDVDA